MSVAEKILEKAKTLNPGQAVPAKTFRGLGSRDSVDQALSRLVKTGKLTRPARGVYMRPKRSRFVGEVPPEPFQVAKAIAEESGYSVQVHGAEAARRLGLSTQVPIKSVFLTDGPSRKFRLGAKEVTLKHVSRRKIALAGRPAGLALTALWYLGKEKVTPEVIAQIRKRLGEEEFVTLRNEIDALPGWLDRLLAIPDSE